MTEFTTVASLHNLLHHSELQNVTVGLHSLVIVGLLLALAYCVYKPILPLLLGMLAPGVVDLLTHRQWAYNHFFPLRLEPMDGIFSYTNVGFTLVEHSLLICFATWWIIKRKSHGSQTSN